jgi:hypothetical protein
MKKKGLVFGAIIILLLLGIASVVTAQSWNNPKDVYDAAPDNEYYVTAFYSGGSSEMYKVPSCSEAVSLKDRLFHGNSSVSSVSIKAKYYVHQWHDACNKTYYR